MRRAFLSYRRDDTQTVTGFLYQHLEDPALLGPGSIFMDIDDIPPGVDFRHVIDDAVSKCEFFLAVIGKQWVSPRLMDPNDFVRLEIETALRRNIPVTPVLMDGAVMRREDQLPPSLHPLLFKNAVEVRHGKDFKPDVLRMVQGLHKAAEWFKRRIASESVGSGSATAPTVSAIGLGTEAHSDALAPVAATEREARQADTRPNHDELDWLPIEFVDALRRPRQSNLAYATSIAGLVLGMALAACGEGYTEGAISVYVEFGVEYIRLHTIAGSASVLCGVLTVAASFTALLARHRRLVLHAVLAGVSLVVATLFAASEFSLSRTLDWTWARPRLTIMFVLLPFTICVVATRRFLNRGHPV